MNVVVLACMMLVMAPAAATGATRPGATRPPATPPLVDEMLTLSRVTRQLAQLPDAVIDGFNEHAPPLDAATVETQRKVLRESYRPERLYPIVVAAVTERYDEAQARAVVQAFRTPLFRRLQALEELAVGPDAPARLRAFSQQLVENRPSVERHVLIRRLDAAMGATALQLEMLGATVRGLSVAMGAVAPNPEQLREIMAGVQEQSMVPLKNHVLLTLLFAYRTVGDDDLRDYLAFWESGAGRWFVTTVSRGLVRAVAHAAETAGQRLKATAPGGKRK